MPRPAPLTNPNLSPGSALVGTVLLFALLGPPASAQPREGRIALRAYDFGGVVADSSGGPGDHNGVADAGETVGFVLVYTVQEGRLQNPRARLYAQPEDERFATIVTGEVPLTPSLVYEREEARTARPLTLRLAPDVPDGYRIRLRAAVRDDQHPEGMPNANEDFTLPVRNHGRVRISWDPQIRDASGDGRLGPGEAGEVALFVTNWTRSPIQVESVEVEWADVLFRERLSGPAFRATHAWIQPGAQELVGFATFRSRSATVRGVRLRATVTGTVGGDAYRWSGVGTAGDDVRPLPLGALSVTVNAPEAQLYLTDPGGTRYSASAENYLEGLLPGQYGVKASSPGYEERETGVEVRDGYMTRLDLPLLKETSFRPTVPAPGPEPRQPTLLPETRDQRRMAESAVLSYLLRAGGMALMGYGAYRYLKVAQESGGEPVGTADAVVVYTMMGGGVTAYMIGSMIGVQWRIAKVPIRENVRENERRQSAYREAEAEWQRLRDAFEAERRAHETRIAAERAALPEPSVSQEPLTPSRRGSLPPAPAPSSKPPEPEIFEVVGQMPELIGGIQGLQDRIDYPEAARRAGIEGRVFVQFVVDERGVPVDIRIVRGIGGGCDEAAVAAVAQARFRPGRHQGRAVVVRMSLPVTFRLN